MPGRKRPKNHVSKYFLSIFSRSRRLVLCLAHGRGVGSLNVRRSSSRSRSVRHRVCDDLSHELSGADVGKSWLPLNRELSKERFLMKFLQFATLASAATFGFTSLSLAHDDHSHNSSQEPAARTAPRYDDDYFAVANDRFSQERFAPSSAMCPRGGSCCESGGGRTIESFPSPTAVRPLLPGTSIDRNEAAIADLENLLTRLQDDLRYETRGLRGQNILLDDNAALLRETRHFGQSVTDGVDAGHLRDDATSVKKSLIQLDEDMERQGRFPESERTLRNFAKLFVAWENNLGLRNRVPVRNPLPPQTPNPKPYNENYNRYSAPRDSQFSTPARRSEPTRSSAQSLPEDMKGIALLSPAEQAAALAQGTCPVTKQKLGSMGKPIRVSVAGGSLWVCCEGCVNAVKANPQKFLLNR